MIYEDFKIGESYDVEGEAEKVICKNDDYKVVTTVNSGNFSTSWDEDELKQFKPLPKQLPKEGLLVAENGSLVYRLSDDLGYGFSRQGIYFHNSNWFFIKFANIWQPATPEQEEKFVEMLWGEWVKMGNDENTKIEYHAEASMSKGLLNQGVYDRKPTCQMLWNKNGVIFYKGKFATPRKETTTTPQVGKQYIHKKGNTYTVVGFTNDLGNREDKDFPVTVIYMDQEGRHWSRPLSRWHGSFELKNK